MVAKPQYITDEKGRKKAVILSMRDYRRLMEDLYDVAVVRARRGDPTISHEELREQLKADGILPD